MKKTERHLLIQQMIRNEKLSTQKEIQDRLEAKGIAVTQTTLSRDLRDLGLVKVKRKRPVVLYFCPMSLRWQRFILCCPATPSLSHEQNSLWFCGQSWEKQLSWPMV